MKLPLVAIVLGLLIGIAATIYVAPETPQGSAFMITVSTLVVTLIVMAIGKLGGRTAKSDD